MSDADQAMQRGAGAQRIGAFDRAAVSWEQASNAYRDAVMPKRRAEAMIDLSAAYCALGQYPQAIVTLSTALNEALAADDRPLQTTIKIRLAQALVLARADEMGNSYEARAKAYLDEAAMGSPDGLTLGMIDAARGDAALAYRHPDRAADVYQKAQGEFDKSGDKRASTFAAANAAVAQLAVARDLTNPDRPKQRASIRKREIAATTRAVAQGREEVTLAEASASSLPSDHDTAYLWLTLGQTEEGLAAIPPKDDALRLRAYADYQAGLSIANAIGDIRAQAYALGYCGHLYELDGRDAEAMELTRRAVFLAQRVRDADCLYRWQWQTGRLLRDQADHAAASGDKVTSSEDQSAALAAYQRAVGTLQEIRSDLAAGGGNQPQGGSFRGVAEGIYYELADLLLRQSDANADQVLAQRSLLDARNTVEQLKSAQVQDYFHERCDALIQSKGINVDTVSPTTAVVYLIPLKDRTEMLVTEPPALGSKGEAKVLRFRANVSEAELTRTVRDFRLQLMDASTNDYAATGLQLYNWLIRPMDDYFKSRKIDTLVFVPDGALRTIPMGALYDGDHFLIEKYSVAVSPGLKLTEPRPLNVTAKQGTLRLLMSGLSVSRDNFPALPQVKQELSQLQSIYGGEKLLDKDFSGERFDAALNDNDYSIVHIASHGEFGAEPADTYVLTYDNRLDLNHLERLIEPSKYKGHPVELLTLSACETAAGDDRAALGLAGVALKAGARSALATLWPVNDEASALLIDDFYRRLKSDPSLSKAQALRQAQEHLLQNSKDLRFQHPAYWAPYLIIGNWL